MKISQNQLLMLSYYRSSEIAGALFFGRLCRQVKDPQLAYFLTEQFMEESSHAWLWTKLIHELGEQPINIRSTYQSNYSKYIDIPTTLTEILLITKVFEERVAKRFSYHLEQADTPEVVKDTIRQMLTEEESHVAWLSKRLQEQAKIDKIEITMLSKKYYLADKQAYAEVIKNEPNLKEFLA